MTVKYFIERSVCDLWTSLRFYFIFIKIERVDPQVVHSSVTEKGKSWLNVTQSEVLYMQLKNINRDFKRQEKYMNLKQIISLIICRWRIFIKYRMTWNLIRLYITNGFYLRPVDLIVSFYYYITWFLSKNQ